MAKIKYLVMDVDGTLTDGKIYLSNSGEEFKAFCIKDGLGIKDLATPAGITPVILTGKNTSIVEKRAVQMGVEAVYQGINNKSEKIKEIVDDLSEVAYIGDDLNDLECMKLIKANHGLLGCPADAAKEIKEISDFVSDRCGGNGAVREFVEYILKK